ncbi:MAG: hypothetical protein LR015_11030 [Verrucomicrobia bacterium]|nr:hypothetical protein [Verrucomicrobiota bacterium]
MQVIDLSGEWHLRDNQSQFELRAIVPGCVQTDLLREGYLPDPWFRDNEKDWHWVCERDWVYTRTFEVTAEFLLQPVVKLRCEGLDTLCTVVINDQTVLQANNMFHPWECDLKPVVKPGENRIQLIFHSLVPYMRRKDAERRLPAWSVYHDDFYGKSYVRKMACSFGWDWGLMAPAAGPWLPISILGGCAYLEHLRVAQRHESQLVELTVNPIVSGTAARIYYRLEYEGATVAETTVSVNEPGRLTVDNPKLWWPNCSGGQPLYALTAVLLAEDGTRLHSLTISIGLRTIELQRQPDAFGESFRFVVNGKPLFMKGSNWIPCDIWPVVSARTHIMICLPVHGGCQHEHGTRLGWGNL